MENRVRWKKMVQESSLRRLNAGRECGFYCELESLHAGLD